MADKMGDELPQNISNSLLNFDKKWRSGGGSARHEGYAIKCIWQHISL
jgi:hypothetical protein